MSSAILSLTPKNFNDALRRLTRADADLARVVRQHGTPSLVLSKPGFATLTGIILEQQVSLAAGRAAMTRLGRVVKPLTPYTVLQVGADRISAAGITRQKTAYVVGLASQIAKREISLARISKLPDAEARSALMAVKGIGPWTADVYLLSSLGRADIWPHGDLALNVALTALKNVRKDTDVTVTVDRWRPYRSVAARIVWHHYIHAKRPLKP